MPVVDVQFILKGNQIPADHSYLIFSALSNLIPWIHENHHIGIHSISGMLAGNRMIKLTDKSRLTVRLPSEDIIKILPVAGKTLSLDGNLITVGIPSPRSLIPAARLYSRLVIIKGFMEPESFLDAVKRQFSEINIKGIPYLIEQRNIALSNKDKPGGSKSPFLRRTIRVRDKEIVGFAVGVENLTAEESILLQEKGIGGRRKLGCGIFIADRW